MSLITTNNVVRTVTIPPKPRHPIFTMQDIAVACQRTIDVAAQGAVIAGRASVTLTRAAVEAGPVTAKAAAPIVTIGARAIQDWLAREQGRPAAAAQAQSLAPLDRREFTRSLAEQQTGEQVLAALSRTPLRVSAEDVPAVAHRVAEVMRTGTVESVRDLAEDIASRHQQLIQREVLSTFREAVTACGLTQVTSRDDSGYLIAGAPDSVMSIRADITLSDEGQIQIATDTHGFHGTTCEEMTQRVFAEAAKRGLHVEAGQRQSKVRISQGQRAGSRAPAAVRQRHGG